MAREAPVCEILSGRSLVRALGAFDHRGGSEMPANSLREAAKDKRTPVSGSRRATVRARATVLLVDDDPSVLGALARLIRTAGYRARAFSRPNLLLVSRIPRHNACVVADIFLPEMNGVELCDTLLRGGVELPYILITGRNDAATLRLIEKSQALAVLFKPIDEVPLLKAISRAVAISRGGTRRR
jgi:FixJ family two-component response regulator